MCGRDQGLIAQHHHDGIAIRAQGSHAGGDGALLALGIGGVEHGPDWQIRDDVRQLVEFRQLNLIGAWPNMPAMDVVMLRNVLIYFDVPTKKWILSKVRVASSG